MLWRYRATIIAIKTGARVRINIYLTDRSLRRVMKVVAAMLDVSVSDYCAQAITAKLKDEGLADQPTLSSRKTAVPKARRFVASTFKGHQLILYQKSQTEPTRVPQIFSVDPDRFVRKKGNAHSFSLKRDFT